MSDEARIERRMSEPGYEQFSEEELNDLARIENEICTCTLWDGPCPFHGCYGLGGDEVDVYGADGVMGFDETLIATPEEIAGLSGHELARRALAGDLRIIYLCHREPERWKRILQWIKMHGTELKYVRLEREHNE